MFEHWLEKFLKLAYDLEPKIKHNYLCMREEILHNKMETTTLVQWKGWKSTQNFRNTKQMEERMQYAWMNKK